MKELNFDGDTFNDMKRDMNFVLQRLLGNMQENGCLEGTLTLKLDVSLVRVRAKLQSEHSRRKQRDCKAEVQS